MSEFNTNNDNEFQKNEYGGNGWSKYQMLVLHQLQDHNRLLETYNKDISLINNKINLLEEHLRKTEENIEEYIEKTDNILDPQNEKQLTYKVNMILQNDLIKNKINDKDKATWAVIGGVAVFIANLIIAALGFFFK